MKKLLFLSIIILSCTETNIVPAKQKIILDENDLKNQIAMAKLSLLPGDSLDFIVFAGQSNCNNCTSPATSINGYVTWDVYKERLDTVMNRFQNYTQKLGPMYYLAPKLKAKFPHRKFIFLEFGKAATALVSDVSSAWRADNKTTAGNFNLSYLLLTQMRNVIDVSGVPTRIDFFWLQGEEDNNSVWRTYQKYEKKLYDTIPQFLHMSDNSVRYYTYLLKSSTDPHYQDSINYAKRLHAASDPRITLFEVNVSQYQGIHMNCTTGIKACADTLVKKIK
ncbi:MAG TPA: hypothetical protein VL443_29900 [Cyclobacteriaceae bacterium]|jgi:hypothetical protein|nr:hypothetical protein [Cyclobacteriaceae bacterium]